MPRGRLLRRTLHEDPTLEYLLYLPRTAQPGTRLLVSVHGSSSGLRQQVARLVTACEREGVALLAPRMVESRDAPYQQLGSATHRADEFLHKCLRQLSFLGDVDTGRFCLLGHSGGAQFAHRYAMAHPHRVDRTVLVASGWYTFPDTAHRFPHGIRSSRHLPGVAFNPEEYLRIPTLLLVGSNDTNTTRLRSSTRIDEVQGPHRVERARRWTAAMNAQAAAHGIAPPVELLELDGAGHSFRELCDDYALAERAFLFLFGGPGRELPRHWPGPLSTLPVTNGATDRITLRMQDTDARGVSNET